MLNRSFHGRRTAWKCQCDCGVVAVIISEHLRTGKSTSCGCGNKTHGMTNAPIYQTWVQMRRRCSNARHPQYPKYGGRGISVCDRWNDFENFLSDMGPKPSPRHSIDRINNDGDYEPSNCRWASAYVQTNNRRVTKTVTFGGVTKSLSEWASDGPVKISLNTLYYRIFKKGWAPERALTTPVFPQIGKNC